MTSVLYRLASSLVQLNNLGLLQLCNHDDPVLRKQARNVDMEEQGISRNYLKILIGEMVRIMREKNGQGIAAPQLGIDLQIIAFEFSEKDYNAAVQYYGVPETHKRGMRVYPLTVFVNPELRVTNFKKTRFEEGCLSLGNRIGFVERYEAVEIEGYDEEGEWKSLKLDGWMARIAQHEMHHLKGLLISDYFVPKRKTSKYWR